MPILIDKTIAPVETRETAKKAGRYVLIRNFILRMTGFPIELMESLAAPELAAVTDQCLLARQNAILQSQELLSSSLGLSRSMRRKIKRGIHLESNGEMIAENGIGTRLEGWNRTLAGEAEMQSRAAQLYDQELERTRRSLYQFVMGRQFQEVLLLSSPELARFTPTDPNPPAVRNSHIRQRELSWISYLQRLATKNETISSYGPCAWGDFDPSEPAAASIQLSDQRISRRTVYIERWVCESLAYLLSSDREIQPLLRLRLPDDLVIEEDCATWLGSGETISISIAEKQFLESCDVSVQRSLGSSLAEELVEEGLLVRKLEVAAMPLPFRALQREVADWPAHPARERWQRNLDEIEKCREAIECAPDLENRRSAIQAIIDLLKQLGVASSRTSQNLYASRLPVNEDCRLGVQRLVLGKPAMDQLLDDAAPWYDLWRDLAGLFATRMHQHAQESWKSRGSKPVPLAAFWPTLVQTRGLLSAVEDEIQEAWDRQLGERWREPLVCLTLEDLAFLRDNFFLRRMKAFDNLSPDLQIVAPDTQALSEGRWSLLIAELHPDFTAWQHCFFIWCPDSENFAADYSHQGGQGSAAVIGKFPPYFSSTHTSLWVYPFAHQWNFVGVRGPEGVRNLRSAEMLVEVTEDDILLRHTNGQILGSILHTWNIAMNTHRLELKGNSNHSPRLQVGRVIVQRETWRLEPDTQLRQAVQEGGHKAFAAWREFREKHGLPDKVFVRGCLAERLTFDKDIKPVFVDFRSPLLLEMLSKMVNRFQKLSITEMLPGTEACWLQGNDGHYSSEFRTIILASRDSRNGE